VFFDELDLLAVGSVPISGSVTFMKGESCNKLEKMVIINCVVAVYVFGKREGLFSISTSQTIHAVGKSLPLDDWTQQ